MICETAGRGLWGTQPKPEAHNLGPERERDDYDGTLANIQALN